MVTDKFGPTAITDKNDPLLATDKNMFGVEVPTALDVCNIPRDTLEVSILTPLKVYNIPENTLEVSSISTTDNTLGVHHILGNMLEIYNIPNTRDNFAGNFDTCAGSFDRLTSDPVLATYRRSHKNFRKFSAM